MAFFHDLPLKFTLKLFLFFFKYDDSFVINGLTTEYMYFKKLSNLIPAS